MMRAGGLDVLAQHIFGTACHAPFDPDRLYEDSCRAAPYHDLPRAVFDRIVDFVATGGYAPSGCSLCPFATRKSGSYRLAHPRLATRYRMNVGTIVEAPMLARTTAR